MYLLKNELDHLSAKNLIIPVKQPTDWVSNVVVTIFNLIIYVYA